MKKAQGIEIGEYLAVAMSVSGTVVALLTEKVIYAAAPLTVAVGLNLWQRKRVLEEKINAQIKAEDWTSLQYQLTAAIERQNRQENATGQTQLEIMQNLQELANKIASVEGRFVPILERQVRLEESDIETRQELEQQLTAIQTASAIVRKLPEQFSELQTAIATLQQQIKPLNDGQKHLATTTQQVETAIVQINATIATLTEDLTHLDRRIPQPDEIQALQKAIADLQQSPPSINGEIPLISESAIAEKVEQLDETLAEIQQRIERFSSRQTAIDPHTRELQAAIARIQKRLEGLPEIASESPPKADIPSEHRPPSVPPEYRREAFTPSESPQSEPSPDGDREEPPQSESPPESGDREEPSSTPPPTGLDDFGNDIEGGIREISENLWEFGASIKNIFDRVTTPETTTEFVREWECAWEFATHVEGIDALAIAPDKNILVSPGKNFSLQLWNLETGEAICTFAGHQGAISALAFSPDANQIASSSTDGTLKLWQVETGAEIADLQGHAAPIAAIAFSPHGRTLITGSRDKTIKLWDLGSQRVLRTLQGHWDWVGAIACDPDGQTLASGSHDGTIKFWDVQKGEKIGNLAPGGKIYAIAYNADGTMLASGGSDRLIRLWNRDRQELRQIRVLSQVYSLSFSPDGKTLASGTSHRTISLWDSETGEKIALLEGHRDRVNVVCFGDRGDILASGGDDGIVRIWKKIETDLS